MNDKDEIILYNKNDKNFVKYNYNKWYNNNENIIINIINKITTPLNYNGTMSITATKAPIRLF